MVELRLAGGLNSWSVRRTGSLTLTGAGRRTGSDMAEALLFHHAQGQTAGLLAFADGLRRAGHTVHAPDLYGGRTFDSLDLYHGDQHLFADAGLPSYDANAAALLRQRVLDLLGTR